MKIFGIGLPKTGTVSLQKALQTLGLKCLHNPVDLYAQLLIGNYALNTEEFDAVTHFGFTQYRAINHYHPDCKFILTVRNKDEWLESAKGQFQMFDPTNQHMERMRIDLFGTVVYEPVQFSIVYDNHLREVTKFFSEIPADRWMMLDVCAGEGWRELCEFLDYPIPFDTPFPHENDNKDMRTETQRLTEETGVPHIGRRKDDGTFEVMALQPVQK